MRADMYDNLPSVRRNSGSKSHTIKHEEPHNHNRPTTGEKKRRRGLSNLKEQHPSPFHIVKDDVVSAKEHHLSQWINLSNSNTITFIDLYQLDLQLYDFWFIIYNFYDFIDV